METLPSTTWRMLAQGKFTLELPKGLDDLSDSIIGFFRRLLPKSDQLMRQANLIATLEKRYIRMPDRKLKAQVLQVRERFLLHRDTAEDIQMALALVSEVAARTTGLRPYPVQIAGALALESGFIAEMATGEGKTLSVVMAAVLAGWRGRGCHVVTANDYLARRDADLMMPIYTFCGLKARYIQQGMPADQRRDAYHSDVTYCTNKEVAADFLRDQLIVGNLQGSASAILEKTISGKIFKENKLVLRGLECAIVDEADSVLIDEAITPLIISSAGPNQDQVTAYAQAAEWARKLEHHQDYTVDGKYREIHLTSSGKQHLADLTTDTGGLWKSTRRREELITQAISAREFYVRDKQYVIENDTIVIVDEFTGRLMPDRSWQNGIHQAIEAKEGLEINLPKETLARISFQRFFRHYKKLSGTTGTGAGAMSEFWKIYHLSVVVIPTHRPCIRKEMPMRLFLSDDAKWTAVVQEICREHETGRPILIGTRSVRASEHLSSLLEHQGLAHRTLNAVHHKMEADIIADAGRHGGITVATNMAGRGTDIRLKKNVAGRGGLHVIATEHHEAGRIDRQLYGRCARQGDPGSTQAFVSLGDELLQQYAGLFSHLLVRYFKNPNREIPVRFSQWLVRQAQQRAERAALRQRKNVLHTDKWMDEHLGFTGNGF